MVTRNVDGLDAEAFPGGHAHPRWIDGPVVLGYDVLHVRNRPVHRIGHRELMLRTQQWQGPGEHLRRTPAEQGQPGPFGGAHGAAQVVELERGEVVEDPARRNTGRLIGRRRHSSRYGCAHEDDLPEALTLKEKGDHPAGAGVGDDNGLGVRKGVEGRGYVIVPPGAHVIRRQIDEAAYVTPTFELGDEEPPAPAPAIGSMDQAENGHDVPPKPDNRLSV